MISMRIDTNFNEVLSVISHEMKSPIALIKANLELMRTTSSNNSSFDMIFRELDNLENMSKNLINTIKSSGDEEKVFILDIVEDVIESYENTHTNIEFSVECENEDVNILGSSYQIEILVNNLVKNAVEAIEQGGHQGFVKVLIGKDVNSENTVVLEIMDNGVGLTADDKTKIYNKFYTTKQTGSGLGLSIVKYILGAQNGHMSLDNNVYGGCTASVVFENTSKKI